ncbi:MAG: hypothetical protein J5729_00390 [Bacteroidaceae bacterium]|nr:hypothetical protein [Bacteroidaceae bacterium]MBO4593628.1 hypothetical protein [Bacteroidaceae bacterium]
MKKVFYLIIAAVTVLFTAACSSDSSFDEPTPSPAPSPTNTPKTTVQLGVSKSGSVGLFLLEEDITEEDVEEINTKFSIRIDNRIPTTESGGNSFNAKEYITITDENNQMFFGTLRGDADYKDPTTPPRENSSQKGHDVLKYIYSSDGSKVQDALLEQPTFEQVKACLLKNNKAKNLKLNDPDVKLKIIWYVAKMQNEVVWYGRNYWHVDGILTFESTKDIDEIPNGPTGEEEYMEDDKDPDPVWKDGEVEVDIHQQNHDEKWNEIKTAIHIRDAVDVTVEIPISEVYQSEADDFRIRVWTAYYKIGNDTYPITVEAIHNSTSIVINVKGVTEEILQHARENSDGDGITVEVNSYYKGLTDLEAWQLLKGSTVSTNAKTTLRGQITSAFFTENETPTDQRVIISYTKADYDNDYPE